MVNAPISVSAPISVGELVDKITILDIKSTNLESASLANVRKELALLRSIMAEHIEQSPELIALMADLADVNRKLWAIEDGKRACERRQIFDAPFVALARSVYIENDKRARIKRSINALTNSSIVEEKSYDAY